MRGTMVSTFPLHPSKLPVSCVHAWGMPNRNGMLTVDRTVLHVTYDRYDTNLIHVYARKPDESNEQAHAAWSKLDQVYGEGKLMGMTGWQKAGVITPLVSLLGAAPAVANAAAYALWALSAHPDTQRPRRNP